jgi:DNA segregation ATPase FtsK/SpoIIIE, S-DNA-T family
MAATPAMQTGGEAEPSRASKLLRELMWIGAGVAALYLALALATYNGADPGWSVANRPAPVANKGGLLGAYLADLALYIFGVSAWWWVVFAVIALVRAWRHLAGSTPVATPRSPRLATGYRVLGFALIIIASSAIEALRFHTLKASLPLAPGGLLGKTTGDFSAELLGFGGGTMVLLAVFATGVTLLFGLSWLAVCERVGGALESLWQRVRQTKEVQEDRALGEVAATIREQKVEEVKKVILEHEPIKIEIPPVEIVKSERVVKEKQVSLFTDLPDTELPQVALLDNMTGNVERPSADTLEFTSRLIERKLLDFNVKVRVHSASPGPVITRYEIEPDVGVKGSQVVNLARDLARALSVTAIRVVETIPGTSYMGLEIPNPKRETVRLAEIIGSQQYNDAASKITLVLGKDIAGRAAVIDLAKTPHLLVAGTTGSGKSVAINAMILSILYKATPADVRMIMIDPKMLELSVYEGIPHLLAPVVTDMKLAVNALNWCVAEMERRYKLMSALGVRNLSGYNSKINEAKARGQKIPHPFTLTPESPEPLENLPLIVVLIDELADLMMVTGKKVEEQIARIAQKARAAGIHLVLATQRPSVDVITGLIKANVPTRIAFQVSSKIDSRTILDQQGAESLLGMGDMLYLAPGTGVPSRMHGAFVSDDEVHRVVEFLKRHGEPDYVEGILDGPDLSDASSPGEGGSEDAESDPMYDQAVQVVLQNKRASISLVQRHLRIGYNRSARLLEAMEKAGLVTAPGSQGNRDIIAPRNNE